ncbi:MAG TPA: hypothetical protein VJK03_03520 [Candidatus Nanoarchaeia archaeon]|nr:hypothetical protein [Candidatus Nanoarchaeia archaeon]
MVSYVLLIIIAVGLSVLVYNYLVVHVPKDKPACYDDINLVLVDYSCHLQTNNGVTKVLLNVTLSNHGLHTADGVYLRLGNETRKVKKLVNDNDIFFGLIVDSASGTAAIGLRPGMSVFRNYSFSADIQPGRNGLEIQPAAGSPAKLALCEKGTLALPVECVLDAPSNP